MGSNLVDVVKENLLLVRHLVRRFKARRQLGGRSLCYLSLTIMAIIIVNVMVIIILIITTILMIIIVLRPPPCQHPGKAWRADFSRDRS